MSTTNVNGNNTAVTNSVLFGSDNKEKTATNKKTSTKAIVIPVKEKEIPTHAEQTPTQQPEVYQELPVQKTILTFREMQEKAEKMHLLSGKYDSLNNKKKDLDLFSISHDRDTARMRITDAKGQIFESSNPVCIRQLIDIWKKSYAEAMVKIEEEMRTLLDA